MTFTAASSEANKGPSSRHGSGAPAKRDLGRDFRILWTAQSISLMGSSLFIIALPWEAYSLTHSTSATAYVSAAMIAPFPVLGLVSGVIADRWDRRRTMFLSDIARAIVTGALALAIALAALRLWMLLVGTIMLGSFGATFDAAYAAATPQIVDRELLNAANGRLEGSSAATSVIGPEVGGAAIAAIGTALLFGLDGLSFVAGAIGSLLLRYRTPTRGRSHSPGWAGARRMACEGVSYLARSSLLRPLTAATATLAFANGAMDGLLVPLLRGHLHYGELAVGAVFSTGALGWLVASVLVARLEVKDHLPKTSLAAVAIAIVGGAALGLGNTIAVSAIAIFAFQGGVYYFLITVVTLRQRIVPSELLGRVHALARSLGNVGTPLGAAVGGAIAGGFSVGPTTALLCSAPLAASLSFALLAARTAAGSVR